MYPGTVLCTFVRHLASPPSTPTIRYEHGLGVDKDEEEANKWRAHHEPDSEL